MGTDASELGRGYGIEAVVTRYTEGAYRPIDRIPAIARYAKRAERIWIIGVVRNEFVIALGNRTGTSGQKASEQQRFE